MSVNTQGKVWELELPPSEKYVLICLSDHADHHGENAYPGLALLEAKTGLSERSLRRILLNLERRGVVQRTHRGHGPGNFDTYSINTEAVSRSDYFKNKEADRMTALRKKKSGQDDRYKADRITASQTGKADICDMEKRTSATVKADICDSSHDKEPARVLTIHEPSMNHTHTQERNPKSTTCVCVDSDDQKTGSRFTLKQCLDFARDLKATGQGITNPGGYATRIHRTGEADSLIEEFLHPVLAPDVNKCPDCEGRGFYYPNGIGSGPVVKCKHEKLKAGLE